MTSRKYQMSRYLDIWISRKYQNWEFQTPEHRENIRNLGISDTWTSRKYQISRYLDIWTSVKISSDIWEFQTP